MSSDFGVRALDFFSCEGTERGGEKKAIIIIRYIKTILERDPDAYKGQYERNEGDRN